jgi:hypothetical protein
VSFERADVLLREAIGPDREKEKRGDLGQSMTGRYAGRRDDGGALPSPSVFVLA